MFLNKFYALINILFILLFSSMSYANELSQYRCKYSDEKAIENTIKNYVDTKTALAADNVLIFSKRCVGSYASAKLHPKKQQTDDAIVYLHKIDNHWKVISLGTAFDAKFLSKLPKQLRKP